MTLAVATAGGVGIRAPVTVLPAMQADFGLDRGAASLPYTAAMIGFALGNLAIGRLVDRWGIALALAGAGVAAGFGFAAAALTGSLAVLTGLHLAVGLGAAACFGPLMADISHWFLRRRGIAVAVAASGNYLSGAIWPMILAGVQEGQGWRATYLVLAAAVPAVVLPLALMLRRRVSAETAATATTAAARMAQTVALSPRAQTALLAVAGLSCCVAMSMPQVHIVADCADLGHGVAAGAGMLSLMLAGGVVSRLISGWLADRLGGLRTLLLGSVLQALALMLFLPFDGLASLYALSLMFGLAQGGIVPACAIILREYLPPAQAGARVGVVIFATILGMALGGWLTGTIQDLAGGYRLAFVNGVAWNLLNLAIAAGLMRSSRPRGAATAA